MENLIGWIVMVLVMQGLGAIIAKKNKSKDQGKAENQSSPTSPATDRNQPQVKVQASNPIEAFFEKLEETAHEAEKRNRNQSDQKQLSNSHQYFEKKQPKVESHQPLNSFEQEWVTKKASTDYSSQQIQRQKRISSLESIAKKNQLQQALIWKEILDKPVALR